jgi:hypothetical protein
LNLLGIHYPKSFQTFLEFFKEAPLVYLTYLGVQNDTFLSEQQERGRKKSKSESGISVVEPGITHISVLPGVYPSKHSHNALVEVKIVIVDERFSRAWETLDNAQRKEKFVILRGSPGEGTLILWFLISDLSLIRKISCFFHVCKTFCSNFSKYCLVHCSASGG